MNSETSLNRISIEYSVLFTEVSLNRVRGVHRGSIVHTDVHCHMSFSLWVYRWNERNWDGTSPVWIIMVDGVEFWYGE